MIRKLIELSAQNRFIVLLLYAVIIAVGISLLESVPPSLVPALLVTILAQWIVIRPQGRDLVFAILRSGLFVAAGGVTVTSGDAAMDGRSSVRVEASATEMVTVSSRLSVPVVPGTRLPTATTAPSTTRRRGTLEPVGVHEARASTR